MASTEVVTQKAAEMDIGGKQGKKGGKKGEGAALNEVSLKEGFERSRRKEDWRLCCWRMVKVGRRVERGGK